MEYAETKIQFDDDKNCVKRKEKDTRASYNSKGGLEKSLAFNSKFVFILISALLKNFITLLKLLI